MEFVPGAVVADRFRLVRVLGKGGMGQVWLAHHTRLDIPCAVKFVSRAALELTDVRVRFEREARAAAQLRSPNVVAILDHGECDDVPYIAMELLEGEDLAHRLARQKRLPSVETVAMVAQVAKALTKAHAAGLVHRDLKPANIFLVPDDDERDLVKVLDFGIAKSLTDKVGTTQSGALLGTPSYMSPEQAQGTRALDARSDLWSLAVVAFECLTGRLPFISEALGDLIVKILLDPIPMPSKFAPELPPEVDAWWRRASDRTPEGRFQTAKELSDALASALGVSRVTLSSSVDGGERVRADAAGKPTAPEPDSGSAPVVTPLSEELPVLPSLAIPFERKRSEEIGSTISSGSVELAPRRPAPRASAGIAVLVIVAGAVVAWLVGGRGASSSPPGAAALASTVAPTPSPPQEVTRRPAASPAVAPSVPATPAPGAYSAPEPAAVSGSASTPTAPTRAPSKGSTTAKPAPARSSLPKGDEFGI